MVVFREEKSVKALPAVPGQLPFGEMMPSWL
jgi:hypothetical protein